MAAYAKPHHATAEALRSPQPGTLGKYLSISNRERFSTPRPTRGEAHVYRRRLLLLAAGFLVLGLWGAWMELTG